MWGSLSGPIGPRLGTGIGLRARPLRPTQSSAGLRTISRIKLLENKGSPRVCEPLLAEKGVTDPVLTAAVVVDSLRSLRYAPDPTHPYATKSIDLVRYPNETLAAGHGDCDDLTVVFAALGQALGLKISVVFTGQHVFAAVRGRPSGSMGTHAATELPGARRGGGVLASHRNDPAERWLRGRLASCGHGASGRERRGIDEKDAIPSFGDFCPQHDRRHALQPRACRRAMGYEMSNRRPGLARPAGTSPQVVV